MMLRMGSQGAQVRDLQDMLNVAVPVQPFLMVDGMFGPKTNQRVVTFQKQMGLMADGIAGPLTGKALVITVLSLLKAY